MTHAITVSVALGHHTLAVTGAYTSLIPGRYHGPWEDCYPDDGADFEVERAVSETTGRNLWPRLPDAVRELIADLAHAVADTEARCCTLCEPEPDFLLLDVPQ